MSELITVPRDDYTKMRDWANHLTRENERLSAEGRLKDALVKAVRNAWQPSLTVEIRDALATLDSAQVGQ